MERDEVKLIGDNTELSEKTKGRVEAIKESLNTFESRITGLLEKISQIDRNTTPEILQAIKTEAIELFTSLETNQTRLHLNFASEESDAIDPSPILDETWGVTPDVQRAVEVARLKTLVEGVWNRWNEGATKSIRMNELGINALEDEMGDIQRNFRQARERITEKVRAATGEIRQLGEATQIEVLKGIFRKYVQDVCAFIHFHMTEVKADLAPIFGAEYAELARKQDESLSGE